MASVMARPRAGQGSSANRPLAAPGRHVSGVPSLATRGLEQIAARVRCMLMAMFSLLWSRVSVTSVAMATLITGCLRTHTISVESHVLLPKLVDIDRRGTARVPARDEIQGPYADETRAIIVELTGADVLPLPQPTGPIRLDALARRCLDPSPALSGEDPCWLRLRRDDVYVVRTTHDRVIRPVIYNGLLGATLGGLAFGGACLAGVCDGAPTVERTGKIVGAVAATATVAVFTWALLSCILGPPGRCHD
jgi:hypothetical protein